MRRIRLNTPARISAPVSFQGSPFSVGRSGDARLPNPVIPATASNASEQRSRPEGRARSASKAGIHFDLVVHTNDRDHTQPAVCKNIVFSPPIPSIDGELRTVSE